MGFLWDGKSFLIYSRKGRRKLKNIARYPRIGLNLNSNATGYDAGGFARAYTVAVRAAPTLRLVW